MFAVAEALATIYMRSTMKYTFELCVQCDYHLHHKQFVGWPSRLKVPTMTSTPKSTRSGIRLCMG